jgi:Uma2 family endonuclease
MPTTLLKPSPSIPTLADLLDRLGGVSAERVRYYPAPGTATVADVIEIHAREKKLFELVDGVLVEKGMGYWESVLAVAIAAALREFVNPRKLGKVSGESGMMQLEPDQLRMPDVAFVSAPRLPKGEARQDPAPILAPDLAVEVLSKTNTKREIERKRREYFAAGTRLAWIVDPKTRTVEVYTSPDKADATLTQTDVLTGGDVLPGFTLDLRKLFAELDE